LGQSRRFPYVSPTRSPAATWPASNACSPLGQTPGRPVEDLEVAIFRERPDMAGRLLEYGAQPTAAGRWWGYGRSCLHAAILLRRTRELLEVLLASDVDIGMLGVPMRWPCASATMSRPTFCEREARARASSARNRTNLAA
jgi:hypothetical protein